MIARVEVEQIKRRYVGELRLDRVRCGADRVDPGTAIERGGGFLAQVTGERRDCEQRIVVRLAVERGDGEDAPAGLDLHQLGGAVMEQLAALFEEEQATPQVPTRGRARAR